MVNLEAPSGPKTLGIAQIRLPWTYTFPLISTRPGHLKVSGQEGSERHEASKSPPTSCLEIPDRCRQPLREPRPRCPAVILMGPPAGRWHSEAAIQRSCNPATGSSD